MDRSILKYLNLLYKVDFKNTKLRKSSNKEFIYFNELNKELNQIFDINEAVVKKILIDWVNSCKKKPTIRFNYKKYWEAKNPKFFYYDIEGSLRFSNIGFTIIRPNNFDDILSMFDSVGLPRVPELPIFEYRRPQRQFDMASLMNQYSQHFNSICLEEPN